MKLKTFKERFEWLKKEKGLTNKDIGDWVSVTEQAVHSWISKSKIPERNIDLICKKFGVYRHWLVDGAGEIWDLSQNDNLEFYKERMDISLRCHQEIARVGLKISDIANMINTQQKEIELMILGYKEISSIHLVQLSKLGFDANYILMGIDTHHNKDKSNSINQSATSNNGDINQTISFDKKN